MPVRALIKRTKPVAEQAESFTLRPPTKASVVAPSLGERSIIAGQTGSGKTTAALHMLARYYGIRQIIIADTKSDPAIEKLDGPVATRLRDLPRVAKWPDNPLVIFRPNPAELSDLLILDAFAGWVYQRGHTVLFIDELGQFGAGSHAGPGLTSIFARGRTSDITVLAGTQRPVSIPIIALTESQVFYVFRLLFKRDRERVANYTHPDMITPPTNPYGVRVYRTGWSDVEEYVSLT